MSESRRRFPANGAPVAAAALAAALSQAPLQAQGRLPEFSDRRDFAVVEVPAVPEAQAVPGPEAGRPKDVDLLPQFPDASNRNQCDVGSCHAFSSIAVLEAAWFRKHKAKVRLSEADIFLRRTVLSGDVYREFCEKGECKFTEGNDAKGDMEYAIANGVATSLAYRDFLERYRKYRAAEARTLEGIQKRYEQMGWLEKLFYDPRMHWAELQAKPESRALLDRYLGGADDRIAKERKETKEKLKGFSVSEDSFKYLGSGLRKLSSDDCRRGGEAQGAAIRRELGAGRPVSVSMSLSGLPAWGQSDNSQHANHAFTIVGVSWSRSGEPAYRTRNSWGGDNPDVKPAELCRVYSILSARTPEER